jgi:hypothetical protein
MDDLEDLLRRYQPARPPSELHDRIADAARSDRSSTLREWVPAAAAAAAIVFFYTMSSGLWIEISQRLGVNEAHDAAVNRVAQSLGDGDLARAEAERMVRLSELTALAEAERAIPAEAGLPK